MIDEVWRDVKGFEGFYKISNFGNLKSIKRTVRNTDGTRVVPETIMKFTVRSGYYNVVLRKHGKRFSRQIHRLVAEAFIPNPQGFPVVNHKDCNRKNNIVDNLEWCTQAHNVKWSKENMQKPKKETHSASGEKYIYLRNGRFRVCFRQFGIEKTFCKIKDAIAFRNEVIDSERQYFEK